MNLKYIIQRLNIFSISVIFLTALSMEPAFTQTGDTIKYKQGKENIAYGAQPDWMVTGATSKISGSDLRSSFVTNFAGTLPGRLSGLTIIPGNNEPGYETFNLVSRGINTFGVGETDILILVDGFVDVNFHSLIPEEIESVVLLKDAAATAMYGSRAANGVLLITTKRGKEGPLAINLSVQYGLQTPTNLPKFLGSYDYARLYNEARRNSGMAELYTETDLNSYQKGDDPYFHPDIDWYNEVLRNSSPLSNYNLNFSGSLSGVRYFVSLNHLRNELLYKKTGDMSEFSVNSNYARTNFRSNVDINLGQGFTAKVSLGGSIEDKENPVDNNTGSVFSLLSQIPPNAFPVYNPNGTWGRNELYSNPLGNMMEVGFFTSNSRTLQAGFSLNYRLDMITRGLSITGLASMNNWFRSYSSKSRTYKSFAITKNNGEITYIPFGVETSLTGAEGSSSQYRNDAFQVWLNYDRNFGVHDVSGILLANADEEVYGGDEFPYRHLNLSGRATYANRQTYISEFSFSYMGSENFPKDKRYGLFPAVSFGWIASNEPFLKDNNILTFLKFKGSYGMVGNEKIGGTRFMFQQYYPYTSNYYFGTGNSTVSGIVQGSPANKSVTWEKEKTLNIGFEATIYNNWNVALEVFNRDRYDILVIPNRTLPDFMGFSKPYINDGKTNNRGFEAKIRYSEKLLRDFNFFVESNLWYHQNKLVFSSENLQLHDYLYRDGHPINQPFGLVACGFFKDENDIKNSPQQRWTDVKPGDVKYVDQNKDNIIDERDLYPIGHTSIPTLSGNLNIGFQCKGIDFSAFFQGVTNRTVSFTGPLFHAFQNEGKISEIALGRWTPETAGTATYPRLTSMDNDNNYRYSTLWQRDGSFIKLHSIELGYTFPSKIIKSIGLEDVRIFVNGTNLFSWNHMKGYRDPEIEYGYPATRSYSMGVKIQLQ
ncbi:MAG: SusC/RagA family TonB-linked outer membrane protein [Bacteroidia bacterium 43-41]|nr:MAG: SusC/RagA family TonB-linked outer membrane protein [Bacteroidia bacterium 43-41]